MATTPSTSSEDADELRFKCSHDVLQVLDSERLAAHLTRGQQAMRVLRQWADERRHAATLLHRITRGNPNASASSAEDAL